MKLPRDIGPIHFVGIGGIGMSGIAEVLANQNYRVRGSDVADSANVQRLRDRGIEVAIGHAAENLGDAAVVVVSSAIKRDNPELKEARARGLPVVRRAEMLAELMRLKSAIAIGGTHGKTTTTSMVAALLDAGGLDPTVINGGIINSYGTNARMGAGDWMVVESDELDGTFVKLPADIVVVTNIDPEHLDHYGTFDALREAFRAFVENVPFYGFAVMCLDHPEVQALVARIEDRRIITYGRNPQAEVRYRDLRFEGGKMLLHGRPPRPRHRRDGDDRRSRDRHAGRAQRFERDGRGRGGARDRHRCRGRPQGACELRRREAALHADRHWNGVAIYDDYGHHPVEIAAVLRAARSAASGRLVAVVQPHRYTRLKNLFAEFCTCFNEADTVIVADVYPAGESADRRREPRRARRRPALRRPPRRARARKRGGAAGARRVDRRAGRHGGLPRRRLDHALGERAAASARGIGEGQGVSRARGADA